MGVAGVARRERQAGQDALAAQRVGDHTRAVALFQAALASGAGRGAQAAGLYHHLGLSLRALGRLDEAISSFGSALALEQSASTLGCLGNALRAAGRYEEAVARHTQAVELDATAAEAWSNLGSAYESWGREQAALLSFEQAAKLRPSAGLLANWAGALLRADRPEAAAEVSARALAEDPRHLPALLNLAAALRAQARYQEAIPLLRQAVALDPQYADAHFNLGLALLTVGQWDEGWRERQWREQISGVKPPAHDGPEPRWDGGPLAGRTLLLRSEQGLGDTLQFIRYAQVIKDQAGPAGGRVLFQSPPALAALLARCPGIDQLVIPGPPRPPAQIEAPLMDLPFLLRPGLSQPEPVAPLPYLAADPALVARWRQRLQASAPRPALRIGIAWQGNPRYPDDRRRSIPLDRFVPFIMAAAARGAVVHVLQKGPGREQLADLPVGLPLVDLGPELDLDPEAGAFVDTAAVVSLLDLVVTSDTALPHLAGALGAPVWTLLAHAPDWRWGGSGAGTPWYPGMRLFRQPRPGDWSAVLAEAAAALPALEARP